MQSIAEATSGIPPAKIRTLKEAEISFLPVQAERRGLSAFIASTWNHFRWFRVRAGPFSLNAAPLRSAPLGGRESARHQPRSIYRALLIVTR